MLRKFRYLEWDEFDVAVYDITDYFKGVKLTGIYGQPRGGLPLAVALSHRLELPLIDYPRERCLWVDDIVETGTTLRKYLNQNLYYTAWFGPKEIDCLYSAETLNRNEWLVFPWEDQSKARRDMEEYELSRQ